MTDQDQTEDAGLDSVLDHFMTKAERKHFTRSVVIIVNFLATVLLACEANLHWLQPHLPVNVYAIAAFALPAINAGLRFRTTQGIAL